jgi:hypothetical protein
MIELGRFGEKHSWPNLPGSTEKPPKYVRKIGVQAGIQTDYLSDPSLDCKWYSIQRVKRMGTSICGPV